MSEFSKVANELVVWGVVGLVTLVALERPLKGFADELKKIMKERRNHTKKMRAHRPSTPEPH